MQEMQVWSLGGEDPLAEEMATPSSILSWRIPWTEEPGRLQSMGSQRVGHNLATKQQQTTYVIYKFPHQINVVGLKLSFIIWPQGKKKNTTYLPTICIMTAFQHVLMKRRDFLTLLLCFTVLNAKALVLWVIALGRQAKLKKIKDLPTPPHRSLNDVEWSPAVSPAGVGPGKCSPLCHS